MKRTLFVVITLLLFPTFATAQDNSGSREILRLGRGTANVLDWRPDGEVLAEWKGLVE